MPLAKNIGVNRNNYMNNNLKMNNVDDNINVDDEDSNNYDFMNKNSLNKFSINNNTNKLFRQIPKMNLDDISILKIQNQVLNKSNLDLKNYNKCLKAELNSYKRMTLGNFNYNNGKPFRKMIQILIIIYKL